MSGIDGVGRTRRANEVDADAPPAPAANVEPEPVAAVSGSRASRVSANITAAAIHARLADADKKMAAVESKAGAKADLKADLKAEAKADAKADAKASARDRLSPELRKDLEDLETGADWSDPAVVNAGRDGNLDLIEAIED